MKSQKQLAQSMADIERRMQSIAQGVDKVAQRQRVTEQVGLDLTIQREPGTPYAHLFPFTLNLPFKTFVQVVEMVDRFNVDGVLNIAGFILGLDQKMRDHGIDDPDVREELIRDILITAADRMRPTRQTHNPERVQLERALWYTYSEMQDNHITYPQAAMIASAMLDETIDPDVWRLRLTRWAKAQQLPPIKATPGRPSTTRRMRQKPSGF